MFLSIKHPNVEWNNRNTAVQVPTLQALRCGWQTLFLSRSVSCHSEPGQQCSHLHQCHLWGEGTRDVLQTGGARPRPAPAQRPVPRLWPSQRQSQRQASRVLDFVSWACVFFLTLPLEYRVCWSQICFSFSSLYYTSAITLKQRPDKLWAPCITAEHWDPLQDNIFVWGRFQLLLLYDRKRLCFVWNKCARSEKCSEIYFQEMFNYFALKQSSTQFPVQLMVPITGGRVPAFKMEGNTTGSPLPWI